MTTATRHHLLFLELGKAFRVSRLINTTTAKDSVHDEKKGNSGRE